MAARTDKIVGKTAERTAWDRACDAAMILAIDAAVFGGASLHSRAGPARDAWMETLRAFATDAVAIRKMPPFISDERLLGGLDLAATLKAGKPVLSAGLLAECSGGYLVITSAERLENASAARVCAAYDQAPSPALGFGIVSFDESINDDEHPPQALLDRQAFLIDLDTISHHDITAVLDPKAARARISIAKAQLRNVTISDDIITAICDAALSMGITSLRAATMAVKVARAISALDGRENVDVNDATYAAQLVLAPRATALPAANDAEPETPPEQPPDPPPQDDSSDAPELTDDDIRQLADQILDAARAILPPDVLAMLLSQANQRRQSRSAGRAGASQKSVKKGRPAGTRRGELRSGARLNLVETLRAAAPWQPLRQRERDATVAAAATTKTQRRIEVRKDDFRIARFKSQQETATIFVVDASGSLALNRLAEAKGAVELLLADCYVRRDHVSLIAFRGTTADLLLPPTRSLARAKRSLAGLPGGGGTPLALGLDAARQVADAVRRKGQTPSIVVLTDGRANISREGKAGRPQAEADGLAAARAIAVSDVRCIVIDTSPQPATQSAKLAAAMNAIYLPLPRADAATLSKAVKAAHAPAA